MSFCFSPIMQQDTGFTCKRLRLPDFTTSESSLSSTLLRPTSCARCCVSSSFCCRTLSFLPNCCCNKTEGSTFTRSFLFIFNSKDLRETSYSVMNLFPSLSLCLSSSCKTSGGSVRCVRVREMRLCHVEMRHPHIFPFQLIFGHVAPQ